MNPKWKKLGVRGFFATVAALTVAVVVLLNLVAGALSERYSLSIDLTADKLFKLNANTVEVLSALDCPVAIQVLATRERFENTSVYNAQAGKMMAEFAKCSPFITFSYIDYIADPAFASRYPELSLKHGDVLVTSGERVRHVKTEELFQYGYSATGNVAITASQTEETILGAVLSVASDRIYTATFLQGHGEAEALAFEELLRLNNYVITRGNILTDGLASNPELVVLAAPVTDFSSEEINALDCFLQNKGNYGKTLFYCGMPGQGTLPNLEAFLAEWGVAQGDGLVFETDPKRVYANQPFYAVTDDVSATYTGLVRDKLVPMLMPISRPLEVRFAQQEFYQTEILLQFGESSGVRPSDATEGFTADDAAQRGPIPALVLATRRNAHTRNADKALCDSYALVSGSAEMLESYALNSASFANAQYITTLLGRLCGQQERVPMAAKQIKGNALNLTQARADCIAAVFVPGIPLAVLALGTVVWLRRRHQ